MGSNCIYSNAARIRQLLMTTESRKCRIRVSPNFHVIVPCTSPSLTIFDDFRTAAQVFQVAVQVAVQICPGGCPASCAADCPADCTDTADCAAGCTAPMLAVPRG